MDTLSAGERNILHLLAVRLLCAVGEKHNYAETVVTVECAGHSFTAKGRTTLREGWKAAEQAFRAILKEKPQEDADESALPNGGRLPELSEGQVFSFAAVSVRESFSSPPKHFSEDTLLSSMESAGTEALPEEKVNCPAGAREATLGCAERRGLGTPATRAAIIEKLVKSGFVERKNKQLFPTQKGVNLIAVLPDTIKSPQLTAEWEHKLKRIEHGKLTDADFMEGIAVMTTGLISAHAVPDTAHSARFARPAGHSVGPCPRCGCTVTESKKGFFCLGNGCKFALWRDNKFFAAKKKEVTTAIAAALLTEGRVFIKGLYSEKIGKTYDATVVLEDTGQYVNFKLDFDRRKTV
ncbi:MULTISPECIES: DNA topoisomerase [Dehalobacter]|uniref:DNA topoisomerase n=1 Tax=Dehalobacter TaxID=56112 RepID=UPI002586994B|nr:DNA topoisomerase [Dehalobacter sp.]MDJ0304444.1 DNA topoisomerase [Dehalobacter sp.]